MAKTCLSFRSILYLVILLVAITIFVMALSFRTVKEMFIEFSDFPKSWNLTKVDYASPELAFPVKCISCEKSYPAGQGWRGQQTKCLSCEMIGGHPQYTHPNKVFANEHQWV